MSQKFTLNFHYFFTIFHSISFVICLTVIVVNAVGKLIRRNNLSRIDFLYHRFKIFQPHLSVIRNDEDLVDARR